MRPAPPAYSKKLRRFTLAQASILARPAARAVAKRPTAGDYLRAALILSLNAAIPTAPTTTVSPIT